MKKQTRTLKHQTPAQYFEAITDQQRQADMKALHALIRKAVPSLGVAVGNGMIGYGKYHYRYDSGREGETYVIGLSSRAAYISLYVCSTKDGKYVAEGYKSKLPRANIGKSCVRFKRLADVDLPTLERLIREGAKHPMGA